MRFYKDKNLYLAQINKANEISRRKFGYDVHVSRIKDIISGEVESAVG